MPMLIPLVIGLGAVGAVAFAMGGKTAKAKPATHKPKRRAPSVSPTSEAAIIAAMNDPAAMQAIIAKASASNNPNTLWNLGRTMLVNSKGKPTMQAAASAVLANAVAMAARQGKLGELVAVALANGDGGILAQAAKSAAAMNPSLQGQLTELAGQLSRAAQPPRAPTSSRPRPATSREDRTVQQGAAAATQVIVDAIKQTGQAASQSPNAPIPEVAPSRVTTLPEVVITPGETQVLSPQVSAAQRLTEYLKTTSRFKEDKSRVGVGQKALGLAADGKYGPGTASLIATLGVVPVPPFYWTKGKAPQQKASYKTVIAEMRERFPDRDWDSAVRGVDAS